MRKLFCCLVGFVALPAWADFEVYFLRHGETTWNRARLLQGSVSETRLTPKGEAMAVATAEGLVRAGLSFDRVYASPYLRAWRTAELVAEKGRFASPVREPRIREMCFGRYEGVKYAKGNYVDDNQRKFFEGEEGYVPQGDGAESFAEVQARVRDFLERELRPLDGKVTRILCVAHSLVLKSLVRELAGEAAPTSAKQTLQRNCCVHVVKFANGKFSLTETGRIFYDPVVFDAPTGPLMVAHRGAGDLTMPEASRPAYSNAVASANDIVKLDLQETKDGVIVMGHDSTLKRNMGWDAKIRDLTYAEILDKGTFKAKGGFANEKIVRLDEALAIVKPVPEFWIDFKRFTPAFAENVLTEFRKAGIDESRIMIATFTRPALAYFQTKHPAIRRVGHIGSEQIQKGVGNVLAYRDKYGLWGVNMPVSRAATTPDDVKALRANGLWVSLWFVQDADTAAAYRESGADAFVTDHVSAVRLPESVVLYAPFSTDRSARVQRGLPLGGDLSRAGGIAFDCYCPNVDPIKGLTLYFRSGAGCYTAGFDPGPTGQWNRVTVDKSRIWRREGKTKGWKNIDGLTLCAWRVGTNDTSVAIRNLRPILTEPEVVVVRGDSCKGFDPVHKPLADAALMVSQLRDAGVVRTACLYDDDVTSETLAGVRLVALARNDTMPAGVAETIADYVRAGGHLLIDGWKLPPALEKLVGEKRPNVHDVRTVMFASREEMRERLRQILAEVNPGWTKDLAAAEELVRKRERAKAEWIASRPKKDGELRTIDLNRSICTEIDKGGAKAWDETVAWLKECGFNGLEPIAAKAGCVYDLKDCRAACHRHGLRCVAWKMCWTGGKGRELSKELGGRRMVGFDGKALASSLCPSDPANLAVELAQIEELCRLGYDEISLDVIRYPNENYCFCDGCRAAFEKRHAVKVANWPGDIRKDAELGRKWDEFRCANVTALVRGASKLVRERYPKVQITVSVFHTFWESGHTVGQDWLGWCREGLVDAVKPMNYHVDSAFTLRGLVRAQQVALAEVGAKTALRPTLGPACWREPTDTDLELAKEILTLRELGLDGFGVFEYSKWTRDPYPPLRPWLGESGRRWVCELVGEPTVICQGPTWEKAGWGPYQFPVAYVLGDGRVAVSVFVSQDSFTHYGDPCRWFVTADGGTTWQETSPKIADQCGVRLPNGDRVSFPLENSPELKGYSFTTFEKRLPDGKWKAPGVGKRFPVPDGARGDVFGGVAFAYLAERVPEEFREANWLVKRLKAGTAEALTERAKVVWPFFTRVVHAHGSFNGAVLKTVSPKCKAKVGPDGALWVSTFSGEGHVDPETQLYSPYYSAEIFRSEDGGRTFARRSHLEYRADGVRYPYASGGFSDNDFEFMPDGSMIVFMRSNWYGTTGEEQSPMYFARSTDMGRTWSSPERFTELGTAPQIARLKNGAYAVMYGRPGLFVRVCEDAAGLRWSEPVELLTAGDRSRLANRPKENPSFHDWDGECGNGSFVPVSDDMAIAVYGDFYWPDAQGVKRKTILCRKVRITPTTDAVRR